MTGTAELFPGPRIDVVLVADGCGVGAAPDSSLWGTSAANTLGHASAAVGGVSLPTLGRWGLGSLTEVAGVPPVVSPDAFVARAVMSSAGCDTPSGHHELMGRVSPVAPAVFPTFDDVLIAELCSRWGVPGVLANTAMGGLAVLDRFAGESVASGRPIVYTSADSVLQVAAHVDVTSPEVLYAWCAAAREVCDERWPVGRIIARPFSGSGGSWVRLGGLRRDWGQPPPSDGAVDRLGAASVPVFAVGKIGDIFGHRGFAGELHPGSHAELLEATVDLVVAARAGGDPAVVFTNLVEFDYRGHARDAAGFVDALVALDGCCSVLEELLFPGDRVVICADHGNDPTHVFDDSGAAHLDHTRELTPMVVNTIGAPGGFHDPLVPMASLGASLCSWWGLDPSGLDAGPLPVG